MLGGWGGKGRVGNEKTTKLANKEKALDKESKLISDTDPKRNEQNFNTA